ncbi:hypothetical protein JCM3770_006851, partial [Rhodotorula araucariae]
PPPALLPRTLSSRHFVSVPALQRELTVKTGEGDLGGFLRLRIGNLGPEHEKKDDDDDDDDEGGDKGTGPDEAPAAAAREDRVERHLV